MVTADKAFSNASMQAIKDLKACVKRHGANDKARLRAAQDKVLGILRQQADASFLYKVVENALCLGGRDRGLSREGAIEIVRRQVAVTLNWQTLRQVMKDPELQLDAGQVRVLALVGWGW
jgi:energy-coupling factor transporter ATP-binding protein EcfA2